VVGTGSLERQTPALLWEGLKFQDFILKALGVIEDLCAEEY
jgi:hypothetical protein